MSVLFPSEVSLQEFDLGEHTAYDNGDWSQPLYHNGQELVVQLNGCRDLFGVLEYSNPTGQSRVQKFSTGVCMTNSNPSVKTFYMFTQELESMVRAEFGKPYLKFIPIIKENKKGEKHLRVKLPYKYNTIQFEIYVNGKKENWSIDKLKDNLVHGRLMNVILALNPVWNSGGKFGISYRLCAIDFTSKTFREGNDYVMMSKAAKVDGPLRPPPKVKSKRRRKRRRRKQLNMDEAWPLLKGGEPPSVPAIREPPPKAPPASPAKSPPTTPLKFQDHPGEMPILSDEIDPDDGKEDGSLDIGCLEPLKGL